MPERKLSATIQQNIFVVVMEDWSSKSSGLLILNGRVGKNKGIGNFTRVDTTGRSKVDNMVVSPQLLDSVASDFAIANACPESDHLPLSLYLRCKSEKYILVRRH